MTAAQKEFQVTREAVQGSLTWFGMFVIIALWRYSATGQGFFLWLFGYIGLSVGIGAFLSRALGRKHKPWARRITQIMIGLLVLGLLGILGHENMQIEGFFFCFLAGIFSGAYLHYFIAKLVGPVVFGRAWCGWACWTMMVMDLFPWRKPNRGRRVLSTECVMCDTCVNVCPTDAIKSTWRFDFGWRELINIKSETESR